MFSLSARNALKPPRAIVPAAFQKNLDAFGAANAGKWIAGGLSVRDGEKLFNLENVDGKDALHLFTRAFDAGQTVVGYRLSADESKNIPNYVAFWCKSTGEAARLEVTLPAKRTMDGTGPAAIVPVNPGAWQRVILPLAIFAIKGTPKVQAVGFGIDSAPRNSDILIAGLSLGATSLAPETLKAKRTIINLKGDWRFAADSGERGLAEKWNAPEFDDANWKILKAAIAWQDQGITHAGWGWYRQKVLVPRESEGVPLSIILSEFPYEDDVYVNGVRVGGLVGNYPYNNLKLRTYTVPPSVVKYGEPNTVAVRTWGVNGLGAASSKSGLVAGSDPRATYYQAELDPFAVRLRNSANDAEVGMDDFDLSAAQQGQTFEAVFRFPADVLKSGAATASYILTDFYGQPIGSGQTPVAAGKDGLAQAVVSIDAATARTIYLRGRFKAFLAVCDANGTPLATDARDVDRLSFAARDTKTLPPLPETQEDTPYGRLKLVDEIDASVPVPQDPHPYMQSGFNHAQDRSTPGAPVETFVSEILGKKARESSYGWFAYRLGRGKLKPHTNYLVRIEYPEDKPRYAPLEIQNGHNFMDIGWKNGVSADDPYDNWPLSQSWQWYDAIVSLDEETTGTSGTGGASAENGFWVYFMNKKRPGRYFIMYQGGPAIGRVKLYEIDPARNAPAITEPQGLPHRTLMVDWERQADQNPEDIVRYCKLMGYNAVSPIMLKWAFMNYGPAMNGYETTTLDARRYWVRQPYAGADEAAISTEAAPGAEEPAEGVEAEPETNAPTTKVAARPATNGAVAGQPSVHVQYLAATKKYGINYVPRIEYGGSLDLPVAARSIGGDGELAKPNRFAQWGANLLHPATWADLSRTVDNYFKPYVRDNPQLTGMLWRIRSDRMQISYGRGDIELFARETGTRLPELSSQELAGWASTGEVGERYATWWHQKREQFHARLVDLLHSYRPDLTLYYYNWDADKFALGLRDFFTASTFAEVAGARYGLVPEVYERHVREQKRLTGEDYVRMIRTGQQTDWPGWGHEYGLRTELYKNLKGMELLAPANTLYLADNPTYLNYFKSNEGLAVSNAVSYDEGGSRTINPKYEGNMVTPAGPNFSMAMEVLAYFHGDARMLTYTVYTYGRGFADAHRRFAQAYLALPAIEGTVVEQGDPNLKVRTYAAPTGTYVGVAYKGYTGKKLTIKLPNAKPGTTVLDLVTGKTVPAVPANGGLQFEVDSGPMQLNSFLVQ